MSFPGWPPIRMDSPADAADDSIVEYYLNHPNGRIVSAFFLGCVFMNGLHYMTSSFFFQGILARLHAFTQIFRRRMPGRRVNVVLPVTANEKGAFDDDEEETASLREYNDHAALIFTLNLCFFLAGLAQFVSLLTFRNGGPWDTGCAFLVAWGGMASQLARLLGLMILTIELNRIHAKRWELPALCILAFVGLGFMFATNATNSGTTRVVESADTAFCYRKRYLPTTVTSSIIRFIIETHLIIRLVALSRSRRRWLSDRSVKAVVIVRACSLLLLDLLTVVPDAISTNVVADFIPFSIGALIVLAAFNWKATTLDASGRTNVQSLVYVSKPTSDPLLAPTPFTLHLPRQYRRSAHSWCSQSAHPVPSTSHDLVEDEPDSDDEALPTAPLSSASAIISIATPAQRRSVKQVTLPVSAAGPSFPHSAPPQFPAFNAVPSKILPSQVAFAAQLEADAAASRQDLTSGPAVPRTIGAQNTTTVLFDEGDSDTSAGHTSPTSAVFGSDILQLSPRTRRADAGASFVVSSAPTQTSFALSPADSRRSTFRRSYASSLHASSPSSAEDPGSALSRASSTRRARLSPLDAAPRYMWRRRPSTRARAASTGAEELAPVREASPAPPAPDADAGMPPVRTRRGTFGHSVRSSRRTTAASLASLFRAPAAPVPPLPAVLPAVLPAALPAALPAQSAPAAARRFALPALALPVPRVRVSPASPATRALFTAPPPAAEETGVQGGTGGGGGLARPTSAGSLRGPRPLPSALLSGGALRARRDAEMRGALGGPSPRSHRRANSSPSEYALQSSVGLETVTRPSMQW